MCRLYLPGLLALWPLPDFLPVYPKPDAMTRSCGKRFASDGSCEDDGVEVLLEEARSAVDPFAAVKLYQKVLQGRPDDTVTMDEAAELMLQLGETEPAKEVLMRAHDSLAQAL